MSTVNIPLLRKMVEWVEEQETRTENREWYQREWIAGTASRPPDVEAGFCDTAFCVAGKVAMDAGWQPFFEDDMPITARVVKGDECEYVENVAASLLGLPGGDHTVSGLFAPSNSAADIRRIAEDLAGERL